MAARIQSRSKLAHKNLGTAVDEGHLRFEDQNAERCHSGCEPEVDDIAVLHNVVLPFKADLAVLAACCHRAATHERVVGHYFRAYEAALNVAVDFARGELCWCAARD